MAADTSREAALDRLVLQYLKKRKYDNAQRILVAEVPALQSEAGAMAASLAPQRDPERVLVADLLFYLVADNDAAAAARSFDRLAAWVDASLDMYRAELARVLYPVFLHTYLDLVGQGAAGEAAALMARHRARFTEPGGRASKLRTQELADLGTAASAEQLRTNATAAAARGMRYPVRLSAFAFELLMGFLKGARLLLPLGTINEHVDLQVADAAAGAGADAGGEEVSLVAGRLQVDVAATNLQPVPLALLKGQPEDMHAERQAAGAGGEPPERGADGAKLSKKARAALARAAERERGARRAGAAERMDPEVPLPALAEEALDARVADVAARAPASPDALPSAAFFTFVNTRQTLTAVTFSADARLVVGCFADSSVRVCDVPATAAARAAPARDPDGQEPAPTAPPPAATALWGHAGPVYAADLSDDGQALFTASGDGTVRLWSTELWANLVAYRGHNFPVWDVAAGPAGLYFASAAADRTARVWATERARPLRILAGHHSDATVVRWHPNSHLLATGSDDRTVRLWDVRDGRAARVLVGHSAAITALAFSPDGRALASADAEGALAVWDLGEARRTGGARDAHRGPVWALAYSQGAGSLLASGGADHTVKLWSATAWAAAGPPPADGAAGAAARPLRTLTTKATPVFALRFTRRNLLLGSGALTLAAR